MTLDYDSRPAELVKGGTVQGKRKPVTVDDLKKAIPAYCFELSYSTGLFYLARDLFISGALGWVAWNHIPYIRFEGRLEFELLRCSTWLIYGYVQGLVSTGIWVLGYESGHGVFSPSPLLNDTVGFLCHTALLTPYFSWQSTHRRHHIYANNLAKDHNYVPPQKEEYAVSLGLSAETLDNITEMTEDAPLVVLLRIFLQQLLGWPFYLINNITASDGCLCRPKSEALLGNSHYLPSSTLFRSEEAHLILASDIGILSSIGALYVIGCQTGFLAVALLYIQPFLWCNHWIVAITFLHHTHPKVPRYDAEAWTFLRGALAAVDRNLGWSGKHLLHNIADYHVIHHLFPRIPQYHAEEATKAIMPLLGNAYHQDKERSFWTGMWESFTQCQWIKADENADKLNVAYWFQAGRCPPPERAMKKRSWT